jgi:predicted metal-binding membrane protein
MHVLQQATGRVREAVLVATLALAAGVAWAVLAIWHGSPHGRYLDHAAAGTAPAVEAGLFAAGWLLMIVAMMLPTSIPLVAAFGALVRRRPGWPRLVVLLVAGYIAIWTAFGVAAWTADRFVHAAVSGVPLLGEHPELIMAGTLLAAGMWQFSPLKYRCLDECRSPLGFVLNRWRGQRPSREAFALGLAHGLFCLGCCWSLMLVMFGVGLGNLAWMLGLGALMAIEKNLPIGRHLTRPLGVALVVAAVAAVAA